MAANENSRITELTTTQIEKQLVKGEKAIKSCRDSIRELQKMTKQKNPKASYRAVATFHRSIEGLTTFAQRMQETNINYDEGH